MRLRAWTRSCTALWVAATGRRPQGAVDAFDVNVKSVHLTLLAARDAGVRHAVYISSMSVYRELTQRRLDETLPADATDLYGLTKRLGEQVCLAAAAEWGLSVNVLRLVWPTPDEIWPAWGPWQAPELLYADDGTLIQPTRASDLGRRSWPRWTIGTAARCSRSPATSRPGSGAPPRPARCSAGRRRPRVGHPDPLTGRPTDLHSGPNPSTPA